MSEFSEIVKQFSITPTVQDTVKNTKPLSTIPVSAVGLVRQSIIIPAINSTNTVFPISSQSVAYIVYQLNYTAPQSFRITNFAELRINTTYMSSCVLCIRYRVGTASYRYFLTGSILNNALVPSDQYTGQIILPNFVIEIWQLYSTLPIGIVRALSLTTSILRNPNSSTDIGPDQVSYTQGTANLYAAINPEALPTTYDASGSWLTN